MVVFYNCFNKGFSCFSSFAMEQAQAYKSFLRILKCINNNGLVSNGELQVKLLKQ